MINKGKTFFIADLHLEETAPLITQQFLQLLQHAVVSADALYILGDLFEVWIGDDELSDFHSTIKQALKSATTQGLPIYFMHGNRDFLIGKQFLQETGCQLLAEEEKILLYKTPVLLMHGDSLCTQDVAYIKARKYSRSALLQTLFLFLPLSLRKRIANHLRKKSLAHTQKTAAEMMDVTPAAVVRIMTVHAVNFLIHGHTHRPHIHQLTINDTAATRIVLGAWHQGLHFLVWDAAGKKELRTQL